MINFYVKVKQDWRLFVDFDHTGLNQIRQDNQTKAEESGRLNLNADVQYETGRKNSAENRIKIEDVKYDTNR